jgi:hypothetical protein
MAVSASKVKAICTASETELVRASRKPVLQRLTATELQRHVTRARKLADKWENQGRKQVRSRSPQAGTTDRDANTELKVEIFRDALTSFSAQLAAMEAAGATGGPQKVRLSKSRRSASHRASRSESRQEIAEQKRTIVAKAKKNATKKVAAGASASAAKAAPAKAAEAASQKPIVAKKTAGTKKAAPPKPVGSKSAAKKTKVGAAAGMTTAKQRKVTTAAKKARIAASGKAGRIQGHVLARGRRAQAARDARN